jgi:hypothetical protein
MPSFTPEWPTIHGWPIIFHHNDLQPFWGIVEWVCFVIFRGTLFGHFVGEMVFFLSGIVQLDEKRPHIFLHYSGRAWFTTDAIM